MDSPLRTFCCGCSLRTGTLIIGTSLALNAAISFVLFTYFYNSDYSKLINDPKSYDNLNNQRVPSFEPILRHLLIFLGTLSVVQLIINLLLLFGTLQDKPRLVNLWLKFYVVMIVANLAADLYNAILYYSITSSGSTGLVFSMIGTITNLVVTVYSILVVHAHYMTMDQGEIRYSRTDAPSHGEFSRMI